MKLYSKTKEIYGYRKQNCGYKLEEGNGEEQVRSMELRDTNYYVSSRQAKRIEHGEL